MWVVSVLPTGCLLSVEFLATPWFLIGFVSYGLSSILWMDVLSKLDFQSGLPYGWFCLCL